MKTKTRNHEYLTVLVNKVGKDVLSTPEMYKLIKAVDAEFGFNCPDNALSSTLSRICDKLGTSVTRVDYPDLKMRGRGTSQIFTINTQAAMEKIKDLKKAAEEKSERKPVVGRQGRPKVIKTTETKRRGRELMTLKSVLEQLYHQLEIAYDTNGSVINLTPTRMRILINNHVETLISADWSQKYKNILRLRNQGEIKNSMISLDSYMKEQFGIEFGACAKFNIVRVSTRVMNQELSAEEERYVLYVIMKTIQHEKHSVDTSSLLKILREHLGVTMDRNNLLDLVKTVKGLSISPDKHSVMFKVGVDPDQVIQEYNPENFKEKVYARIGMAPEEVIKYFPASLVSKISECDGIYELLVDKSFKSREMLLKLYRTFRGTDMILGSEEIVNYLNLQMAKADGLYKRNSFLYELETK